MKTLFVFILSSLLIIGVTAQETISFRGKTINVPALNSTCGNDLVSAIINYTLVENASPYIVTAFTSHFSDSYLVQILEGNIAGKDTNIVYMMMILSSSDMTAKTELVGKLLYYKNKNLNKNIDSILYIGENISCTALSNDFRNIITGKLIAVEKFTETIIIEQNGNLFKCNYYTVKE